MQTEEIISLSARLCGCSEAEIEEVLEESVMDPMDHLRLTVIPNIIFGNDRDAKIRLSDTVIRLLDR
jgi:hypothetical protein